MQLDAPALAPAAAAQQSPNVNASPLPGLVTTNSASRIVDAAFSNLLNGSSGSETSTRSPAAPSKAVTSTGTFSPVEGRSRTLQRRLRSLLMQLHHHHQRASPTQPQPQPRNQLDVPSASGGGGGTSSGTSQSATASTSPATHVSLTGSSPAPLMMHFTNTSRSPQPQSQQQQNPTSAAGAAGNHHADPCARLAELLLEQAWDAHAAASDGGASAGAAAASPVNTSIARVDSSASSSMASSANGPRSSTSSRRGTQAAPALQTPPTLHVQETMPHVPSPTNKSLGSHHGSNATATEPTTTATATTSASPNNNTLVGQTSSGSVPMSQSELPPLALQMSSPFAGPVTSSVDVTEASPLPAPSVVASSVAAAPVSAARSGVASRVDSTEHIPPVVTSRLYADNGSCFDDDDGSAIGLTPAGPRSHSAAALDVDDDDDDDAGGGGSRTTSHAEQVRRGRPSSANDDADADHHVSVSAAASPKPDLPMQEYATPADDAIGGGDDSRRRRSSSTKRQKGLLLLDAHEAPTHGPSKLASAGATAKRSSSSSQAAAAATVPRAVALAAISALLRAVVAHQHASLEQSSMFPSISAPLGSPRLADSAASEHAVDSRSQQHPPQQGQQFAGRRRSSVATTTMQRRGPNGALVTTVVTATAAADVDVPPSTPPSVAANVDPFAAFAARRASNAAADMAAGGPTSRRESLAEYFIERRRSSGATKRMSVVSMGGLLTPRNVATPTRVTTNAQVGAPDPMDGSYSINGYVVLDTIGHGAQGEVFMAFDSGTNEFRAVKSIVRPRAVATRMGNGGSGGNGDVPKPLDCSPRAGSVPVAFGRDRQRRQRLAREVAIMKRCRHPNIVRLYEVIDDPSHDRMYLVMQHVEHGSIVSLQPDGTAATKFASASDADPFSPSSATGDRNNIAALFGGPISPIDLAHFADQIVSGLQYLHRRGILHRDLKPDNILLGAHDTVYLSDFGVSELFDTATTTSAAEDDGKLKPNSGQNKSPWGVQELMTPTAAAAEVAAMGDPNAPHAGTMAFMAPELLIDASQGAGGSVPPTPVALNAADRAARRRAATPAVDVWALGVSLYALLYGRLPWEEIVNRTRGRNPLAVIDEIANRDVKIPNPRPSPVPPPTAPPEGASPPRRVHTANTSISGRPPLPAADPVNATAESVSADARTDDHTAKVLDAAVDTLVVAWISFLRGILVRDASRRPNIDAVAVMLQEVKAAAESVAAAKDVHDATSESLSDSQQHGAPDEALAGVGDEQPSQGGNTASWAVQPPANALLFPSSAAVPGGAFDFATGSGAGDISPRVISKASIAPVSPNINAALQAAGSPTRRQPPSNR